MKFRTPLQSKIISRGVIYTKITFFISQILNVVLYCLVETGVSWERTKQPNGLVAGGAWG